MSAINTSYLFGNDVTSGWGPRYFYSFYGEFGERSGAAEAEAAILSITFLVSVVLNVTIAAAVLRYKEMRNVTNCFLLNLTVADVVFALGVPLVAVTRISQDWELGDVVCKILPYSQFVCGFVLLWTLTLISMDRHRCIVVPPYRSHLTPKLATTLTIFTWLLAAVLFLPVPFWFRTQIVGNHKICTIVFPKSNSVNLSLCFIIPVLLFACILPMALLVFHYQRIFRKLLITRNRWMNQNLNNGQPRRESNLDVVVPWTRRISFSDTLTNKINSNYQDDVRLSKHIRVVRVLLLNVVAVLIMWLPITIIMFLIYLDGKRPNEDVNFFLNSHHFVWALLIALLNTIVNPLLYGILSENFRACFARLWFGSKRKRLYDNKLEVEHAKTNISKSNVDIVNDLYVNKDGGSCSVNREESGGSGKWNVGYVGSNFKQYKKEQTNEKS